MLGCQLNLFLNYEVNALSPSLNDFLGPELAILMRRIVKAEKGRGRR